MDKSLLDFWKGTIHGAEEFIDTLANDSLKADDLIYLHSMSEDVLQMLNKIITIQTHIINS